MDGLVAGARTNNLRLVLLWFGGFKNAAMHFAPSWVKEDTKTYPRMIDQAGNPMRALATHAEATIQADARAFAAFMRHLKQIDGEQHTVIAVQVQNESGVLGTDRDHSESANKLFAQRVPPAVLTALKKTTAGTWTEVFGPHAAETFAAYYQALYDNRVAEAGKKEFPVALLPERLDRHSGRLLRARLLAPQRRPDDAHARPVQGCRPVHRLDLA